MHDGESECFGEFNVAREFARSRRRPRAAHLTRVARDHGDRNAIQARQTGDDGPAPGTANFEQAAAIEHGLQDRPDVVRPAAIAWNRRIEPRFRAAGWIGALEPVRPLRRSGTAGTTGTCGLAQMPPARCPPMSSTLPVPACKSAPPSCSAVTFSPAASTTGRTRREHLADAAHHDRVMTRNQPRRAKACDRAEAQGHDGYAAEVSDRLVETGHERHISRPDLFDLCDRSAAARAIEQAHEWQPVFAGHPFQLRVLLVVVAFGRAAAHREIVGAHHDRTALDRAAAAQAARCAELHQAPRTRRTCLRPPGCPIRGTSQYRVPRRYAPVPSACPAPFAGPPGPHPPMAGGELLAWRNFVDFVVPVVHRCGALDDDVRRLLCAPPHRA